MKTIILSFSISHTSVSDYFIRLSNKFAENYQVFIITDRIDVHPYQIDPRIRVEKWPSNRPTKIRDFKFVYGLFSRYRPVLTISVFGSVNLFLIVGTILRIKHRVAWVRTLSSQFPQKKLLLLRKRWVYRLATKIIANSQATKKDLQATFQVNGDKIKVLPNSVSNYFDQIDAAGTDVHKIVYVGRLHQSKGVDVLIRAFAAIQKEHPQLILHIIGSGPEEGALRALVHSLALENSVLLKGVLPKNVVLRELKQAYCSVVPSRSEAFGFTVIEAMSMRTCVIGADNTGISEIIQNNFSGLLFKTDDVEDLASKLGAVLNNVSLRNQLAENGYVRFQNRYDVNAAVERDYKYFSTL